MNMHNNPAASLPIPRATLEGLERDRDNALAALLQGFDALAAGMDAAKACAHSFARDVGLSDRAKQALLAGNGKRESWDNRNDGATSWRECFANETRRAIDRAVWSHVIEATDLEKVMDREERDAFRASLMDEPPAPTAENVRATLERMLAEGPAIFRRGVANAFAGLDRRFRSHDGFKIGGRVILDRLFSDGGFLSRGRQYETLRDIERAFSLLDDKEHPDAYAGVAGLLDGIRYNEPRPVVVESDWVRIRVFQNGNAHLWFKRDDLVRKVNRVLADYYGEAIGEGSDVADVSDMGPGYHVTPARNFGFFPTPEPAARALFERIPVSLQGLRVLEPSAGKGALADRAFRAGAFVQCVEIQPGLCEDLRRAGHNPKEADFLTLEPSRDVIGHFDGVIMNPPFDRGRDCDHVRHALQFVKPGGFLVAIMSAGTEFRDDARTKAFRAMLEKECVPASRWGGRGFWEDLPAGSFAEVGTNVNTVTLAVRKKEA